MYVPKGKKEYAFGNFSVHGKVLVGVQEGRHPFEQITRGTLRVSPMPHP